MLRLKKERPDVWKSIHSLVFDEFRQISRNGMIVITYEEMTNVIINILADFLKFQREGSKDNLSYEKKP